MIVYFDNQEQRNVHRAAIVRLRRTRVRRNLTIAALMLLAFWVNTSAQDNPQLSPEQVAVLEQLKKDQPKLEANLSGILDPILVGRHVVFGNEWLNFIGPDKPLSREQFFVWRNQADRIYDSYVELLGKKPDRNGEIIFIEIRDGAGVNAGSAIQFGRVNVVNIIADVAAGSWNRLLAHEIAHMFQGSNDDWNICSESTAEFLPAYVLETIPEARYGNQSDTRYKQLRFERASNSFSENRIEAFRETHSSPNSACELYLQGLVDVVGWDTYKKTFQSYHNGTPAPTKKFVPDEEKGQTDEHAQAREFFDRLAYFHDEARASKDPQVLESIPVAGRKLTGKQALRSLSDKGVLLDRYFSETSDIVQAELQELVSLCFPGWTITNGSSLSSIEDQGFLFFSKNVLVTLPASHRPCVLSRTFAVPKQGTPTLRLVVTHHDQGTWDLIVKIDNREVLKRTIGREPNSPRWKTIDIDLTRYAGKTIKISLEHHDKTESQFGSAYWSEIRLPASESVSAKTETVKPTPEPTPTPEPSIPVIPLEEEIRILQTEIKDLQTQLKALPKTRSAEPEAIRLSNELQKKQNRLNVLQSGQ